MIILKAVNIFTFSLLISTAVLAIDFQPETVYVIRHEFGDLTLGFLILFAGISALAVYALRSAASKSRALLWFGLASIIYGLRILSRLTLVHLLFDFPGDYWHYFVGLDNYLIMIPTILFAEELYGKGWKNSLRRVVWLFSIYAPTAIMINIYYQEPYFMPDPAMGLVILMPVITFIGYIKGYRPPRLQNSGVLIGGCTVFILSVINEHLINAGLLPWNAGFESYGFIFLIFCLGYLAVKQFIGNEKQLFAVEEEMKAAKLIQESILPKEALTVAGLKTAYRYIPMTSIGGDFYSFAEDRKGGLGVLIADVTGHGVPAALVSSMLKVSFSGLADMTSKPAEVMSRLNTMIFSQVQDLFCTACYVYIEANKRKAFYASAGHPPILVCRVDKKSLEEFGDNDLMFGVLPDVEYTTHEIDLKPGDRILLCTDGIIEAEDAQEEFFGDHRLRDFVIANSGLTTEEFTDSLIGEVFKWSENSPAGSQSDDIALIVIDVK